MVYIIYCSFCHWVLSLDISSCQNVSLLQVSTNPPALQLIYKLGLIVDIVNDKRPRYPEFLLSHLPSRTRLHLYVCLLNPETHILALICWMVSGAMMDDRHPWHDITLALLIQPNTDKFVDRTGPIEYLESAVMTFLKPETTCNMSTLVCMKVLVYRHVC